MSAKPILLTRTIIYRTACAGNTLVCASAKLVLQLGSETPYFYTFILHLVQKKLHSLTNIFLMRAALLMIPFLFVLAFASCSKTCFCTMATLYPSYVSFNHSDTDTIILRRYDRNSNFNQLLDTAIITDQNAVFNFNQDTLSIRSDAEALTLRSFYNYVLYLPALNRSDSISHIIQAHDTQKGSSNLECNCINRILSYQLNSDTVQVIDPASPHVYIKR